MRDVLWGVWQVLWGCVQSLLGLVVFCGCFLRCGGMEWFWFRGEVVSFWGRGEGMSLGLFLFLGKEEADRESGQMRGRRHRCEKALSERTKRMLVHEYGHCLQSALLGPLYLIVIGLPSFIWCRSKKLEQWRAEKGISYYDLYAERWADAWAERFFGKKKENRRDEDEYHLECK